MIAAQAYNWRQAAGAIAWGVILIVIVLFIISHWGRK